ncbi:hypothetical protein RN001_010435 [Aquatica leii]|uniref:Uncharacterized protein n=1 Tax=Aquatica leii TaxID=1421715 RepID=A0AAN7P6G5_9COLE|nr:hypothetical protein RN001_010435 [Aquatica leii]
MILTIIVFLTCNLHIFTEGNVPCLQIRNVDDRSTVIESTIWVQSGEKLMLECFVNCTACTDGHSVWWHHNKGIKPRYLRLSIFDETARIYVCRHAPCNLTRSVRIQGVTRRRKRDDYYSKSFDELVKEQKDIFQQYYPSWPTYITDKHFHEHDNVEVWGHKNLETQHDYDVKISRKPMPKIVIIVVIIIALLFVVSVIAYCVHSNLKKRSVTTAPRRDETNAREVRSLNVDPYDYRPNRMPVANPVQSTNSDETAPPPSYEEAMYNVSTAPLNGNFRPSAPRL